MYKSISTKKFLEPGTTFYLGIFTQCENYRIFFVTQILREMNFGESKISKSNVLPF